jgi:acyl-coenzyme A thioesterase PaaI-like protein
LHWGFNVFPAFRGTGGRLISVSPDFLTITARLRYNWRTKNIMGSVYGGSLFAVTDGPHPIMLMAALGPESVVLDKAASIRYRKPAYEDLTVQFHFSPEEILEIEHRLQRENEFEYQVSMDLTGMDGSVFATVDRTLYVTTRRFMAEKRKARQASQTLSEVQNFNNAASGNFETQQSAARPKETDDGKDLVKAVPP